MTTNTEKNLKLENSKKQLKSPNSAKSPNASRSRSARVKKALVAPTVPNLKNQKNLVTTTNAQAKKKLKTMQVKKNDERLARLEKMYQELTDVGHKVK
jgi:hypothetical protein